MEGASQKLEEKEHYNDAKLKALEDEAQTWLGRQPLS